MKKRFKLILITLILGGLIVPLLGCSSEPARAETQTITVQQGDLTIDTTAVGNLAFSRIEDLAFEIAGTVEEVLVEEGEHAEEGQVLAKLDPSEWEEQLETLEDKVETAERQLREAQRQVPAKELAVFEAQISLQTAEDNMSAVDEIAEAEQAIEDAEWDLDIALAMHANLIVSSEVSLDALNFWQDKINSAKARIEEAQEELAEILAGTSLKVTTEVAIEVAKQNLQVELAKMSLENAQIAVDDAKEGVADAEKEVEDARETLDEAQSKNPIITAPFDGFITRVNVEGGDEVMTGTVAVQLADPQKFEAEILVSEWDIFQIKLGGEAWVQVDAISGLTLPAEVTYISPTATIQQGVVNYRVRVEIQSLETIMQERQGAMQEQQPARQEAAQQGELSERLQQAVEEGRITREQAEEMMKQVQSGEMPLSPRDGQGGSP
jgi:multidrug efflux pump subunit AcrA (membrane-fusion protein)